MIGIEKGDIMKINEVNTMTPRQNDLVVKNDSTCGIVHFYVSELLNTVCISDFKALKM